MANDVVAELNKIIDDDRVHQDKELLAKRAVDTWPLKLVQKAVGASIEEPLCVVQPTNTKEVASVLHYLYGKGIPIVPYGGGSGVIGGAYPSSESVVIDVSKMNGIVELDEDNLMVTVKPGVIHQDLENYLQENGYISGHYPQSIELAQIGGLVATRSSGQFSTKYGNIEDLVIGVEAVLPTGEVVRIKNVPRRSTGPDLRQLLIGSEGTLGVITEVTLKIFPKPAERWMCAYAIDSMRDGLKVIQRFMKEGWSPAVVRLHDQLEAEQSYAEYLNDGEAILLILTEGAETYAQTEGKAVDQIIREGGGRSLGAAPVESWLEHRNNTDELEEFTSQGIIVDTIEIAANWTDVAKIYEEVTTRLKEEVPELLIITGHSSHSYEQGTSLYFILGAYPPQNPEEVERVYHTIWSKVMEITLKHNGSICHHHGIGKLRAPWMEQELGSSYTMLKKVKQSFDPLGIMNSGTLLPNKEEDD